MKSMHLLFEKRHAHRALLMLAICLPALLSLTKAAVIETPVTASSTVTLSGNETISTRDIQIVDGVTLTIQHDGDTVTGYGNIFGSLGAGSLTISPVSPGGSGRIVFDGFSSTAQGGVMMITAASTVNITNAGFINNKTGDANAKNGTSGVMGIANADARVTLSNVLFENNLSYGNTGVSRIASGQLTVTDGIFKNNYAPNANAGVFGVTTTAADLSLNRIIFENNRARTTAGVLEISNIAFSATFTNIVFKDNWAGQYGGAIRSQHNSGELTIKMTAGGGTNSYMYSGNVAGGVTTVTHEDVRDDISPAAAASAGGFYHGTNGGILKFDIDPGITLSVGNADEDNKQMDTLASSVTTGKIAKAGAGDLILNANNSYWRGAVEVEAGRLLLGNDQAALGASSITVMGGAVFGGAGAVANAASANTASVFAYADSTIQVGLGDRLTEEFAIDGTLTLDDATLSYVAFGGAHATKLSADTLVATGTNIINMQGFVSGVYNLGDISLYNSLSAAEVLFAANGNVTTAGARQGAALVNDASNFLVQVWTDAYRAMRWNGPANGDSWDVTSDNWVGVNNSNITRYASGDMVEFSNDIAGALSIGISSPVTVAAMKVSGSNETAFTGAGGITGAPYENGDADAEVIASGLGQLVKEGMGTLVFNNGANNFSGGVFIYGGAIEFGRGDQLQAGSSAIMFKESGTLRINENSVQLAANINIDATKSAVLDTNGNLLEISGVTVSGQGTLVKTGAGTLELRSANTHLSTELREGVLNIYDNEALGAGVLTVSGNNAVLGVEAGVTISNDVNIDGDDFSIYPIKLGSGTASITFAGALRGKSVAVHASAAESDCVVFSGMNFLEAFYVAQNARVLAGSAGALGGSGAAVTVEGDGVLEIGILNTAADSMTVRENGRILFRNATAATPLLKLEGGLVFDAGSIVTLDSEPTGTIWLVDAAAVTNNGVIIEAGGADIKSSYDNGNFIITKVNPAVEAAKDVTTIFDAMFATTSVIYSRISGSFLPPAIKCQTGACDKNLWIKGVGSYSGYEGDSAMTGFHNRICGALAGADWAISPKLLAGTYVGYSISKIDTDNNAETKAQIPQAGVYGAIKSGPVFFELDAMVGSIDAETLRFEEIGYATGSYKGVICGLGLETGVSLKMGTTATFRPLLGAHYMGLRYYDQSESGPGAVIVKDFSVSQWNGTAGVQFSQAFKTPWKTQALFDFTAAWRSRLGNQKETLINAEVGGNPDDRIVLTAGNYNQNGFIMTFGLSAILTQNTSASIYYDYELGRDHYRHAINMNLRWSW